MQNFTYAVIETDEELTEKKRCFSTISRDLAESKLFSLFAQGGGKDDYILATYDENGQSISGSLFKAETTARVGKSYANFFKALQGHIRV